MTRITYRRKNGEIYMSTAFTNDKSKIQQMADSIHDEILEIRTLSEKEQKDFTALLK